jgi:hypothetical protein
VRRKLFSYSFRITSTLSHSNSSINCIIYQTIYPNLTVETHKVNKYLQLLQILGEAFDPSDSGTNKLIQTVLMEIIDILRPGIGDELKVKHRSNCKWVSFV